MPPIRLVVATALSIVALILLRSPQEHLRCGLEGESYEGNIVSQSALVQGVPSQFAFWRYEEKTVYCHQSCR